MDRAAEGFDFLRTQIILCCAAGPGDKKVPKAIVETSHNAGKDRKNLSRMSHQASISLREPIQVLHIISDLCVAGAEMKLYKLLAQINRERFAPAVISMRDGAGLRDEIEALGIPVYRLGIRGSLPGPASVYRLLRLVRQLNPDLIHGWMYHGNLAAQVASVFARRKTSVLWSIHRSLYSFEYEKRLTAVIIKLCARISKLPDKIIYNSNIGATQHEAAGYDKLKSLVLCYGFDTERFAPSQSARRGVRSELAVPQDAFLVGLVGRYHPMKDHRSFLRAAAQLSRTQPQVRFVLCGKGVDWNNASLAGLVHELRLAEQVHLLGERNDIPCVMTALDIAVSSSSCSEGFPNVVGEAMSSGVPCVVTEISDLPEIVGTTGRVVPPKNSAALAAAIEEMIAIGPARRQELGAAARARVIERYSLESAVAEYEAVYESMVAQTRTANHEDLLLSGAVRST